MIVWRNLTKEVPYFLQSWTEPSRLCCVRNSYGWSLVLWCRCK